MDFEDQLRSTLERKEAPPDFAARVTAEARRRSTRAGVWAHRRRWIAVPVAASLVALVIGLEQQRERRERQGEAAKAQLMQALQITSGKLDRIHKKVMGVLK